VAPALPRRRALRIVRLAQQKNRLCRDFFIDSATLAVYCAAMMQKLGERLVANVASA
jgi:hypothetical protein